MKKWDFRLTPARPGLAAAHLRGIITADAYAEGRPMHIVTGIADMRRAPSHEAPLDTQALFGEDITIYEDYDGWGWGQLARDGYVGYIPMAALADGEAQPTHRVAVNRTFIYPCPDMKMPARRSAPFGALVHVFGLQDRFARIGPGAFVIADHLRPRDEYESDFVAIAERLMHAPYLWGGKTCLGLDCSGLVQISLQAAGIEAPRDTDLQEKALGRPLPLDADLGGQRRGDLVFWPGHAGIMRDEGALLHANAHHMLVVSEPLRIAAERILVATGNAVRVVKRLAET